MNYLPVAAAALILFLQLFLPPPVAVPDNGDYAKMISVFRLRADAPGDPYPYFSHAVARWRFDPAVQPQITIISSEWLLLAPPVLLFRLLAPHSSYDIRITGFVHSLLYLWALWLIAPLIARLSRPWPIVLWSAILLLLCDAAITAYFNTFYTDTASFLFFALAAAFYLRLAARQGPFASNSAGMLISMALFLTSKIQHALLVFPLALLWLRIVGVRARPRLGIAGLALLIAAAAVNFVFAHPQYPIQAGYNMIFLRLVPLAEDPAAALGELGLDERYLRFSGTNAFQANNGLASPELAPALYTHAHPVRLLAYYARHPAAALRQLREGLSESSREYPPRYGYYTLDSGRPLRLPPQAFAFVSGLRHAVLEDHWVVYLALMLTLTAAGLFFAWQSGAAWFQAAAAIAFMAWLEFALSSLADCVETTRHLVFFRYLMDCLLVLTLAAARAPRAAAPAPSLPARPGRTDCTCRTG